MSVIFFLMPIKKNSKESNKGFLVILCGLPASGKSKFAKSLKNLIESKIQTNKSHISQDSTTNSFILNKDNKEILQSKVGILDTDIIRNTLFGDNFEPSKENTVRKTALDHIRKMLEEKMIVISDDINYFESMRHEYVTLSETLKCPYFIVYISTPLEVCIKWNNLRKNPLKKDIIIKISDKFDKPGTKYQWDSPLIEIDLSKIEINKAVEMLYEKIVKSLKTLSTEKKKNIGIKKKKISFKPVKMENEGLLIQTDVDSLTRKFLSIYMIIARDLSKNFKNLFVNGKLTELSDLKKKNVQTKFNLILNMMENLIEYYPEKVPKEFTNFDSSDPVIKEILQILNEKTLLYDNFFDILLQYGISIQNLNKKRHKFVQDYYSIHKNMSIKITEIFSLLNNFSEKMIRI